MKRSKKKLENRLAKRVLAGKITVDDARRKLGRNITQKSAVPSLTKAEFARPAWPAQPRYLGDDEYIRAAIRAPIPRPAVTRSRKSRKAGPGPQQLLTKARAAARDICNPGSLPPPAMLPLMAMTQLSASWTPVQRALLRDSQEHYDPAVREAARAALAARTDGRAAS